MFFEGANGTFGGIDIMVVRWNQLYLHLVLFDVFLNGLGAFVIHDVEHRLVLSCLCRILKTSMEAVMKDALVRFGIGRTMMTLRS